ncbi:MAG TPA: histidine kinase [Nocardioidaceae bacterium]|nr:histidine kinase [Nocardioidaceae bacterium]
MTLQDLRITSIKPTAVEKEALLERLRLTAVALGYALLGAPALLLLILTVVSWPLVLVGAGLLMISLVVPATALLTRAHRAVSGALLGEEIPERYADDSNRNLLTRPVTWLRDPARWRDFAFCAFSATGGFVLSVVTVAMLTAPIVHLVGLVVDGGWWWLLLLFVSGPMLCVWWLTTPALMRARAMAERGILGGSRIDQLERRVDEVATSRSETLDHSAAEVRRIERDLHDGAQARIVAVGMDVGLAEKLLLTDPESAARLLRNARETSVSALEDLRSVVRGIHPPVLADRGLAGAIEALTLPIPLPVTLSLDLDGRQPPPVESAAYFAVAECLANTVKHAAASRAWVTASQDGQVLRLVVGDDGRGGADPAASGLDGVRRRLAAFDGTMDVASPSGGPTTVTMELPCAPSSPRTRPSSASD